MKKSLVVLLLGILLIGMMVLTGCQEEATVVSELSHEDGTYRGVFIDRDAIQVNLQFTLEDNVVTAINFRALSYAGTNYLTEEEEFVVAIRGQHEELIGHLVGQDIRESLSDLYEPGDFVEDVDAFSGATLRGSKAISAIRDGLNRGVYRY